jgi:hypothetical protein
VNSVLDNSCRYCIKSRVIIYEMPRRHFQDSVKIMSTSRKKNFTKSANIRAVPVLFCPDRDFPPTPATPLGEPDPSPEARQLQKRTAGGLGASKSEVSCPEDDSQARNGHDEIAISPCHHPAHPPSPLHPPLASRPNPVRVEGAMHCLTRLRPHPHPHQHQHHHSRRDLAPGKPRPEREQARDSMERQARLTRLRPHLPHLALLSNVVTADPALGGFCAVAARCPLREACPCYWYRQKPGTVEQQWRCSRLELDLGWRECVHCSR